MQQQKGAKLTKPGDHILALTWIDVGQIDIVNQETRTSTPPPAARERFAWTPPPGRGTIAPPTLPPTTGTLSPPPPNSSTNKNIVTQNLVESDEVSGNRDTTEHEGFAPTEKAEVKMH